VKAEIRAALAGYLLGLGDDELILAHRDSEWTGHAPILEEDIAFANIALDEMGHASVWYRLIAELSGSDPERHPDELIFSREPSAFRNVQMVELPNGDWAFSMLRQYLFDAAEAVRLDVLASSQHAPLAQAAAKIRTEELYHLRHTSAWVHRLGLGTDESNRRMQQALDVLYPLAFQLFALNAEELELAQESIVPSADRQADLWISRVREHLSASSLRVPEGARPKPAGRDQHTPHLEALVAEMQEVARVEVGAEW